MLYVGYNRPNSSFQTVRIRSLYTIIAIFLAYVIMFVLFSLFTEQLSEKEEEKILQKARQNKSRSKRKLLPQTKKILDDFYRPYNKEMALLMGDDKFLYPSN